MATERDLAIRLSVKDSEIVRKALTDLGADGQKALARIEQASAPASKALLAVNDVTASIKGEMSGLTGRLGLAGQALSSLGTVGLVAGAAIAGVGAALTRGALEQAKDEESFKRLEAVIAATGNASGVTAGRISEIGDEMEATTMASKKSVLDAAAALSTFRSVSGDAFERALRLSQDMAAVFGGDMASAALQLGRALENPADGLTMLARKGVQFTDVQRDQIRAMQEAGNVAEAQGMILDALSGKLGGAGVGEATGLTGALTHASAAWDNLLKAMSESAGIGGAATRVIQGAADAINNMATAIAGPSISAQIDAKAAELAALENKIATQGNSAQGRLWVSAWKKDAEKLAAELAALSEKAQSAANAETAAAEGAANAASERNAEAVKARLKALADERVKAETDASAKVRNIQEQLAKDVAAAQAKTGLAGVTQADVDKEVALLRDVARQKIDAVQKPLLEAQQRAAEQTAKVLADLQREVGGVADPRGAFVDQKVSSLPKTATPDEVQQAAALAGELYDLTEAKKADAKAEDERTRAIERGRQFLLQHADAETVYKLQLEEIAELKRKGAVDDETYALMVEDAEKRKLRAATDTASGTKRALQDYQKDAANSAKGAEAAVVKSFSAMEDAIVKFATTGKVTFTGFANSVISDMIRMAVRQSITAPLAGAFLGLFHSGGVVGDGAPMTRMVDPRVFVGAQKRHMGGLAGDEVPIIAKKRERVLTEAQQDNTAATISGLAKMAAQGGGGDLKVVSNVYNNAAGTQASTQVSRGADGSVQIDTIVETIEGRMATNIGKGRGLAPTLEGRYGLSAAAGAARG